MTFDADSILFSIKVDIAPNSKQDCVSVEKDKPCTAHGNQERRIDRYNNLFIHGGFFKSLFFPSDNVYYKNVSDDDNDNEVDHN